MTPYSVCFSYTDNFKLLIIKHAGKMTAVPWPGNSMSWNRLCNGEGEKKMMKKKRF
jgi:hypothetical protein